MELSFFHRRGWDGVGMEEQNSLSGEAACLEVICCNEERLADSLQGCRVEATAVYRHLSITTWLPAAPTQKQPSPVTAEGQVFPHRLCGPHECANADACLGLPVRDEARR